MAAVNLCAFVVVGSILFLFFYIGGWRFFFRGRSGEHRYSDLEKSPCLLVRSKLETRIHWLANTCPFTAAYTFRVKTT